MNIPDGRHEVEQMFGHPANAHGHLDLGWMHLNIVTVRPPLGWHLFYQQDNHTLIPTSGIQMHRLLADSFQEVLMEVWNHACQAVKAEVG